MTRPIDIVFSPTVRAMQQSRGSAALYADAAMRATVDERLEAFLAEQRSFYLATVSADGQPYIQHRGGPPGFLRIVDDRTLGWADFSGNRQYISIGNAADNPRAAIFLMDYARRRRIKLWGSLRIVEDDPVLAASLSMAGCKARVERAILFHISAWDVNCPQHIPQMLPADDVIAAINDRDARIASLEAELSQLRPTN
jgi:predicted pyridoxine 5'-phosphate oxidase superfamily flavin-nucleotide-binding protein